MEYPRTREEPEIYRINTIRQFSLFRDFFTTVFPEILKVSGSHLTSSEAIFNLERRVLNGDNDLFLCVALLDDSPVAMISCEKYLDENESVYSCLINYLYIDRGLWFRLMWVLKVVERWAISRHCTNIVFVTAHNTRVFNKLLGKYNYKPNSVIWKKEL